MNSDLLLVVSKLKLSKQTWSYDASVKLQKMGQIAQAVQDRKWMKQYSFTVVSRNGEHFIECHWSHPRGTPGVDMHCACGGIEYKTLKFKEILKTIGAKECGEYLYRLMLFYLGETRDEE